ncbi:hypothetical protein, partial [uncultured Duncaniella sp.]|uniref:hypothetical protein n=1 Tax=uncultured Duncaniella sp. TaxID=2768039 RepID=UPI002632559A
VSGLAKAEQPQILPNHCMICWMEIVFKVLGILFNFFKIGGYEIYAYLCTVFLGTRGKIWLLATSSKMLKLQKVF